MCITHAHTCTCAPHHHEKTSNLVIEEMIILYITINDMLIDTTQKSTQLFLSRIFLIVQMCKYIPHVQ